MVIKEVNFHCFFFFFCGFGHLLANFTHMVVFFSSRLGNFNVAEHIQEGSSNREKITTPVVVGVVLMILVQGLLF